MHSHPFARRIKSLLIFRSLLRNYFLVTDGQTILRELYKNQGKATESSPTIVSANVLNKINTFDLQHLSLYLGT